MPLRLPRRRVRVLGLRRDAVDPFDQWGQGGLCRGRGLAAPGVELQSAFGGEERGEEGVPGGGGGGVKHALEADVFVEPEGPVGGVAGVDAELGAEEGEAGCVGCCCGGGGGGGGGGVGWRGGGVDGAEFAVPDGGAVRGHEEAFADEGGFEGGVLGGGGGVGGAGGEAHHLWGEGEGG